MNKLNITKQAQIIGMQVEGNSIVDNLDEEWLMSAISSMIETTSYPGIPYRKEGTFDNQWGLDSHNDWAARIVRKGEIPYIGEQPLEHDTLEVYYCYESEPLEALRPWLEHKFGKRLYKG